MDAYDARLSLLASWFRFVDIIERHSKAVDHVVFRFTEGFMQQIKMRTHFEANRRKAAVWIAVDFAVSKFS